MFPKKEYVGRQAFFIEIEHTLQLTWAGWEWTPSSSCSQKCWKTPEKAHRILLKLKYINSFFFYPIKKKLPFIDKEKN